MLFYLTDSLIVSEQDVNFKSIYQAVHCIANQVADGSHLLTGDEEVLLYFRKIFQHDLIIGQLFNHLYQNYATAMVPSCLTFYLEVVAVVNIPLRFERDTEIVQMHYSYFSSLDRVSRTILICEDLNDTCFFRHVLDWYMKDKGNLRYAVHGIGAGGRNVHRTVSDELSHKHICICIIDTDKKYEGCIPEQDGTYGLCVGIGNNVPYYKFLPLNVHEIENLIPLNYIDKFDVWINGRLDDKKNKRAFDYLIKDADNILPYFDYKKGIKKGQMYDSQQEYRLLAQRCYEVNVELKELYPDFDSFIDSLRTDIIYPHLIGGSGVLKRTLELIENNELVDVEPVLIDFQKENWINIGQAMLNWCVARNMEQIY